MKRRKKKNNFVARMLSVLATVLLILLVAVCLPLTVPRVFGYEIYSVVSGSMEPAIMTGSLVYVQSVPPEEVQEAEIIAFHDVFDTQSIITHRVVTNSTVMGEFITKGDANEENDMNPIPYSHFVGKVVLSIPKAGFMAQAFTGTAGKMAAASFIVLAVLLQLLSAVLTREKE